MTDSARFIAAAVLAAGMALIGVIAVTGAPSSAAAEKSTTAAVIGDFGSGTPAEADVARLVGRARPSLIVTAGDNIYAPLAYRDAVGRFYDPKAIYPAAGNHDYSQGPIGAYRAYFPTLKGRTVYSVRRGPMEFFILDSQAALDSAASMSGQRAWLQHRLSHSTAPWKVVVLHHPPYSSGAVHGSTPQMQWPFATWGADLVISGHDHDYERIDRGGAVFIVDGTGGASLYPFGSAVRGSQVRIADTFGALILDSTSSRLTGEFRAVDGGVRDTFTLSH